MLVILQLFCGNRVHQAAVGSAGLYIFVAFLFCVAMLSLFYRGVWNPMKISDIGFLKTELNRTDLKIQKLKTQFPQFCFQKPTSAAWGQFFTLSHSQFILQHDRINSQHIFLHAISLHFYF